jgi:hypothetical protein
MGPRPSDACSAHTSHRRVVVERSSVASGPKTGATCLGVLALGCTEAAHGVGGDRVNRGALEVEGLGEGLHDHGWPHVPDRAGQQHRADRHLCAHRSAGASRSSALRRPHCEITADGQVYGPGRGDTSPHVRSPQAATRASSLGDACTAPRAGRRILSPAERAGATRAGQVRTARGRATRSVAGRGSRRAGGVWRYST